MLQVRWSHLPCGRVSLVAGVVNNRGTRDVAVKASGLCSKFGTFSCAKCTLFCLVIN